MTLGCKKFRTDATIEYSASLCLAIYSLLSKTSVERKARMFSSTSMEKLKVPVGMLCLIAFVGVACKLSSLTGAKMTKSREVVFGSINISQLTE